MRMFRSILSIIALLFGLSPAFAASEKISDLTAGTPPYDPSTLMELSVPNGSGGWNSRKGLMPNVGRPLPFFGNPTTWTRPSLSSFPTWINQTPSGLSTATATDGANGLPLSIAAVQDDVNGGGCLTALVQPIAAPPWTITAAVAASGVNGAGGLNGTNTYYSPIVLYDSVSDKAITINWWGGGQGAPSSTAYPGLTRVFHYSTTVLDNNTDGFVSPIGIGFPFPDYFAWFKVINDGVNITYYISQDGVQYFQIYSEAVGYLATIDKVGFGFDRAAASGQFASSLLWGFTVTFP